MDFRVSTGKLVEKERRTPHINQFAVFVDSHSRFWFDKINSFRILAVKRGGDFWIRPDGIAAEHIAVLTNSAAHILQNDGGGNSRRSCWQRHDCTRVDRKICLLR